MGSMQGLAALRDFEPADVAFGSKDEVSFHSRMSAFAGFRHWRPQSAVTSRPGNHADPHETSRPAQSLRCRWAVPTARENETDTSGFTTVLKPGRRGSSPNFN